MRHEARLIVFIGVAANNFQLKKKRREEVGKQRFSTFNVHGSEIGACQDRSVLGPAACGLRGWGRAARGPGSQQTTWSLWFLQLCFERTPATLQTCV